MVDFGEHVTRLIVSFFPEGKVQYVQGTYCGTHCSMYWYQVQYGSNRIFRKFSTTVKGLDGHPSRKSTVTRQENDGHPSRTLTGACQGNRQACVKDLAVLSCLRAYSFTRRQRYQSGTYLTPSTDAFDRPSFHISKHTTFDTGVLYRTRFAVRPLTPLGTPLVSLYRYLYSD